MSSNFRKVILVLLAIILSIGGIFFSPGPTSADSDIDAVITLIGDTITVTINGSGLVNYNLNDVPLEDIIGSISTQISAAYALSAPNSQWSGANVDGIKGPYDVWPNQDITLIVLDENHPPKVFKSFKAVGCGEWGHSIGAGDMYARINMLMNAIHIYILECKVEKMQTKISVLSDNVTDLRSEITAISDNVTDLRSKIELLQKSRADYALSENVDKENNAIRSEMRLRTIVGIVIVAILVVALFILFLRRRTR